ncbi:MAG: tetratricopeptide repeat protein [Elusimicrobia bacterium]|nr:tetratricopeptide repeat protein [Elusimicrobiota bacterium]
MTRLYNYLIYALLFIPPLIFFTDLTRNPYYFQIVLLNGLTVILWMIWLSSGLKNKQLNLPKTILDIPLLSFLGVASVSWILVFVANFSDPYLRYSIYSEGLKRWLFLLVNQILVFYAAYNFANDNNRLKFINFVLWAGFISSLYGIVQYFGIEPIWPRTLNPFGGRSVSTFGNPTFLSSYIVLLFPIAFVNFLFNNRSRPIYFFLIVTFFSALLCTLTRSSWGGLSVSILVSLIFLWKFEKELLKKKGSFLFFIFGLFLILLVFWPKSKVEGYNPTVIERLSETAKAEGTYYAPWHQRRLIWSCAWHMIKENPFLGKGWGCFELFYPFYQGRHLFLEAYRNFRTHANNTHNEILEIWSQTGIIGFGIYLWILIVFFRYSYFLIKSLNDERRFLAIALTSSAVGMLADNILNVSINFPIPGFLYWWNLGLLFSLGSKKIMPVKLEQPLRKLVILTILFFSVLLLVRYTKDFIAEVYFFKGFKASRGNDLHGAIKELGLSYKFRRLEVNNNYELANAYARQGAIDKAIFYYGESLRANAGYDEIYFNMANMLSQKGEYEKAIDEYSKSLYLNPVTKEEYIALGGIFLQKTDYYAKAGIKLLEQCVFFFPNDKDVWNNLGFLYTRVNADEKAVESYKKALEIDPDFVMARKNLAVTFSKLGKKDLFLEKLDSLFAKAEQNIALKNWQKVLDICEQIIKLVPKSLKANLYLANAYFSVGRLEDAIEHYNEALKLDSQNQTLLGNLGVAYSQAKNYKLAKQKFEDLLRVNPQSGLAKQKLSELEKLVEK